MRKWMKLAPVVDENEEIPEILREEVYEALTGLRRNKAAGSDKIENSTLKCLTESVCQFLIPFFNQCLESGNTPVQWHLSEIILIRKKGNRSDLHNYRPISLTSNINKVFMKVLKNRMYNTLDSQQPLEQAGSRKWFPTIDRTFTSRQIIFVEKSREYGH